MEPNWEAGVGCNRPPARTERKFRVPAGRVRIGIKGLSVVYLVVVAYVAVTDHAIGPPADYTAVERAAYRVLDMHCARCHEAGHEGGFANSPRFGVLDLRRVAKDRSLVTPGDPMASKLRYLIGKDTEKPMPQDCYAAGWCSGPTDEEVSTIDAWIESLAPVAIPATVRTRAAGAAYDLPVDATAEEAAAYRVFAVHCARCHQEGQLKTGLSKAKSGLGFVLELDALAESPRLVKPGKPEESLIFTMLGANGVPTPMPDDGKSAGYPTDQEIEQVGQWIRSLAAGRVARSFVSLADQHVLARDDLSGQQTDRWDRIRYLSLRIPHNDVDVSAAKLHGFRTATLKLLNALSWNAAPFRYRQVRGDDEQILIRIFLPELEWTADTWELLEEHYPHGFTGTTDGALRQLREMTGTAVPIVRADWFAAHASVSPLYYDILGLPETLDELTALPRVQVDMRRNIRDGQVLRAGFQDSGVSTNNRLIERHGLGSGFFWTSYDFAGSAGRQNLFNFPLGPPATFPDSPELEFQHDGGESIFTLPNGFHAYYLNAADGSRLDVGPNQIVRDDDYTDGTGEVMNAISCMSCHSRGIRFNEDQVRTSALNNMSFTSGQRQRIGALYKGAETVTEILQRDERSFLEAMRRAGLDPEVEAGGREPIRGLFMYYIDDYVGFPRAANELGLPEEDLRRRIGFVGSDLAGLFVRLDQSPAARDEWNAVYPIAMERVTDYEPMEACPQGDRRGGVLPLPYSVRQLSGCPEPDQGAVEAVRVRASGALTVFTDRQSYIVGEQVRIFVEPRTTCRLTLINIDGDGDHCVLFPHPALSDEPLSEGKRFEYPPSGFVIRTTEVGTETVRALCNSSRETLVAGREGATGVSCGAQQRSLSAEDTAQVVYRTLAMSVSTEEKTTDSGVTYKAFSSHNPDIVQAQISFEVTAVR